MRCVTQEQSEHGAADPRRELIHAARQDYGSDKFTRDLADELERALDQLEAAKEALREIGCLSEGAHCEIRPSAHPCPRCAALAALSSGRDTDG